MITKKTIRPCPICEENQAKVLHNQKFSSLEDSCLPKEYDLVCCNNCGFVYADTMASQSDYDKYYRNLSKYEDDKTGTGGGGTVFDLERMKRTAEDIVQVLNDKGSSILDIGCANGGILALLKEAGYTNLVGLDPSSACVSKIKEKGIQSSLGGLFDIPKQLRGRKFDCIILSHVMEHVRDVALAVQNITDLLAEDGLLYVEVPDAEEYHKNYIVPYYYFDSEHINHFDLNSLKNLGMNHGVSVSKYVKKMIQVSNNAVYPAIGVFFKRNKKTKSSEIILSKVKKSVLRYLELSQNNENIEVINKFFRSGEKIVVWGAGQFTQRLLRNTKLGKCNIVAFIDNDSVKQRNKINGIPIVSPGGLVEYPFPILICSALHSREIMDEIQTGGFANKVYAISGVL